MGTVRLSPFDDPAFDGMKTLGMMVACLAKNMLDFALSQIVAEELKRPQPRIEDALLANRFTREEIDRHLPHALVILVELYEADLLTRAGLREASR